MENNKDVQFNPFKQQSQALNDTIMVWVFLTVITVRVHVTFSISVLMVGWGKVTSVLAACKWWARAEEEEEEASLPRPTQSPSFWQRTTSSHFTSRSKPCHKIINQQLVSIASLLKVKHCHFPILDILSVPSEFTHFKTGMDVHTSFPTTSQKYYS